MWTVAHSTASTITFQFEASTKFSRKKITILQNIARERRDYASRERKWKCQMRDFFGKLACFFAARSRELPVSEVLPHETQFFRELLLRWKSVQRNGLHFPPLPVRVIFKLGASQTALGIRENSNGDQRGGPRKFSFRKRLLASRPPESLNCPLNH